MEALEIPPTAEATAQLAPWMRHCASVLKFSTETIFRINLGLEEWIANLLTHAQLPELGRPIRLELARVPEGLELTVIDHGEPFDPMQIAVSPLQGKVEDTHIGGQGLHLIRLFCQELRYVPATPGGGEGNRLVMFYFEPGE